MAIQPRLTVSQLYRKSSRQGGSSCHPRWAVRLVSEGQGAVSRLAARVQVSAAHKLDLAHRPEAVEWARQGKQNW